VRRINLGWWLDRFAPALLVVSVLAAVCILIARALDVDPRPLWAGYAFGILAAAHISLLWVRKRGFGIEEGLVRLEIVHRLHNALTAAHAGVGPWPTPPEQLDFRLRWIWKPVLGRVLAGALLLGVAWWLPLHADEASARYLVEEPAAWRQVEAWLDTLQEQEMVDEASIEEMRRQVEQLRAQPTERWYEHGSLEAGDSLNEQMRHSLREFQRHLEMTYAGLSAMNAMPENMPDAWKERWQRQMKDALEGLEAGALRLDPEWLSQLQALGVDPSQLRALTAEEWARLKEALERGLEACGACTGEGDNLALLLLALSSGGMCDADGMPGLPGISKGGGGDVPLTLRERLSRLEATGVERLSNPDFQHASLGETLAVSERDHEIDESLYTGAGQSGGSGVMGGGGETVWQQSLDPKERRIVQEFFQ
jgi:hypothetical protein